MLIIFNVTQPILITKINTFPPPIPSMNVYFILTLCGLHIKQCNKTLKCSNIYYYAEQMHTLKIHTRLLCIKDGKQPGLREDSLFLYFVVFASHFQH